jgi:hypothetical protein
VQQSPLQALIGARLALPTALVGLASLAAVTTPPLMRRFRSGPDPEPRGAQTQT